MGEEFMGFEVNFGNLPEVPEVDLSKFPKNLAEVTALSEDDADGFLDALLERVEDRIGESQFALGTLMFFLDIFQVKSPETFGPEGWRSLLATKPEDGVIPPDAGSVGC